MAQESRAAAPVTEEDLEEHLVSKWRRADVQVDIELGSVMALHKESFQVGDVEFLKDMFEKGHHPTGAMARTAEQIQVHVAELEGATFDLTMKQLEYDADSFGVYLQKVSSFKRATYFRKLEWDQEQHRSSFQVARAFLERHTLMVQTDTGDVSSTYKDFRATIKKQHNLADEDLVGGPRGACSIRGDPNKPGNMTGQRPTLKRASVGATPGER